MRAALEPFSLTSARAERPVRELGFNLNAVGPWRLEPVHFTLELCHDGTLLHCADVNTGWSDGALESLISKWAKTERIPEERAKWLLRVAIVNRDARNPYRAVSERPIMGRRSC